MNKIDCYILFVDKMEAIMKILAQTQSKPNVNRDNGMRDYEEKQKTVELAVFLKIVRLIKFLYTNILLLKEGDIMASAIICRAIDEDCEDISFIELMTKITDNENIINKKNEFLKLKQRLIDYFYNPHKSEKVIKVKRSEIQEAIDELQVIVSGLDSSESAKKLYGVYSMSVHSKCEAIANLVYNFKEKNMM